MQLNIKEARKRFSALLDQAEGGEEILLSRRGKVIAKVVPSNQPTRKKLPSLKSFRNSIKFSGKSLSRTVIQQRRRERY